jgi:hypothetical protein
MKFLLHSLLLLLTFGFANAQEKPTERQIRFLAIGDMPPFRQEIRDGVRYELEAEPGTLPPRLIEIPLGEEKKLETTLSLGAFSPSVKLPSAAGSLTLRKKQGEAVTEWHKLSIPENGDWLVVLWRDPQKNTWDAARSAVITDDLVTFPAGSVRLINALPTTARFVFTDQSMDLKAGGMKVLPLPQATTPVQISVLDAEQQWRIIYQSAISQNPGERGNVILYRADGVSPRNPVKVLNLRERAPAPPAKKP